MNVEKHDDKTIEYNSDQMNEINEGKAAQIDTSWYEKPDFTANQMRQIRLGLMDGLDVSVYADPSFDCLQMKEIREGLKCGIDIIPFIREGYDAEQLEQIRISYEHDVDIRPFLSTEYNGVSLEEIRVGIEKGLDVSVYAKPCYNWLQMRELRYGLEAGIDILQYANPWYSYKQMEEIRKGLECGLPVSFYGRMCFSAADMRKKRLKMQENMSAAGQDNESEHTIFKDRLKEEEPEEDKYPFKILISPDDMEVHLLIVDKGREFTEENVLHALWENKIRKGILRKEIRKVVDGTYKERSVLVACGQAPHVGKDGWYEYFFRTDITRRPKVLDDGSVDYQNAEWFDTVKAGDKLAVYHPAEDGYDGFTVKGRVLSAMKGKEQKALVGTGFRLEPDKVTYVSVSEGWVDLKDDKLEVSNVLVVEETTLATGNIIFNGSVHIKGNVGSRTEIRAAGDVMVDGFVEAAIIESGGNVMLKQGMNASGRGCIIAGNDVTGKFLEGVRVRAGGNIEINYCLNCDLEAGNHIDVSYAAGTLVGGRSCAVKGITAQNVGNRAGVSTYIKIGINEDIIAKVKKLKDEIRNIREELDVLENAKEDFEHKYTPEFLSTQETYSKLDKAIYTKKKQLGDLNIEKKEMNEELKLIGDAKVVVRGRLYEGTTIDVNGKRWHSRYMMDVTIRKTIEDDIAVYRN